MAKDRQLEKLKKTLDKKINNALEQTAQYLGEEIEMVYENAISSFYNDYTPLYYNRTYSLYYGSDGYTEFGHVSDNVYSPISNGFEVGISVSPDNIPGEPYTGKWRKWKKHKNQRRSYYQVEKKWVFSRAFMDGIHGFNKRDIGIRNKDSAKYGLDNWKPHTIPKDMKPKPVTLMNRGFKNIAKRKHINNVFTKNIEKQFY